MKKFIFTFLPAVIILTAVLTGNKLFAQAKNDTIVEKVQTINDRVTGVEERLATAESDLAKLTKIKISGYIQAQWEYYENTQAYPYNYFSIRRGRVKIQYEPISGVCFVLQPDFTPAGVTVKDAYVQLNEPWIKTFSLWAGLFNRPDYEVEYSSSQREVPERSRVIRALYPGERALGAKLEIAPPKVPLKFQFMVLNGNDYMTTIKDASGNNINPANKDFDPYKDLMGRLCYNIRLGNFGGLDLGASYYLGYLKSNSTVALNSDYTFNKTMTVGQALNRNWFGAEMQLYMDILGGMSLKGEFLMGKNAYPGYTGSTSATDVTNKISNDTLFINTVSTKTALIGPSITRQFMGYYVYLIKNIGKRNQLAIRWDYYDPNTKIKGSDIGVVKYDDSKTDTKTTTATTGTTPAIITNTTTKTLTTNTLKSGAADIAYGTLTLAWNYYFTDNIRIMLAYEIPWNEKVGTTSAGVGNVLSKADVNGVPTVNDFSRHVNQNVFTLRLQAKF